MTYVSLDINHKILPELDIKVGYYVCQKCGLVYVTYEEIDSGILFTNSKGCPHLVDLNIHNSEALLNMDRKISPDNGYKLFNCYICGREVTSEEVFWTEEGHPVCTPWCLDLDAPGKKRVLPCKCGSLVTIVAEKCCKVDPPCEYGLKQSLSDSDFAQLADHIIEVAEVGCSDSNKNPVNRPAWLQFTASFLAENCKKRDIDEIMNYIKDSSPDIYEEILSFLTLFKTL